MNKEEKKAIESIKFIQDKCRNHETIIPICSVTDLANAIDTVLHLIGNQQKEINKLKEQNKKYQGIEEGTTIIYKSKAKYVREDRIERYYVDKNEIREKIEFIKSLKEKFYYEENVISILQELLGE